MIFLYFLIRFIGVGVCVGVCVGVGRGVLGWVWVGVCWGGCGWGGGVFLWEGVCARDVCGVCAGE